MFIVGKGDQNYFELSKQIKANSFGQSVRASHQTINFLTHFVQNTISQR